MRTSALVVILTISLILTGCTNNRSNNPITPDSVSPSLETSGTSMPESQTERYIWGYWDVRISEDRTSGEVIPRRMQEMHLNTLNLLQNYPCSNCLRISELVVFPPDELTVKLTLEHPFPDLDKFTGFDVRGIFITGSNFTFPVSGRNITWGGGHPQLLFPDGYTPLFNPTEYPPDGPTVPELKYIPGNFSIGDDLSATLNPFVAYRQWAPRSMFEAGETETRELRLRLAPGPLEFGYAVDACWKKVPGPVTDPVTDFPPDANCIESYRVELEVASGLGPTIGNQVPVQVRVYDHQGPETISTVTIEAPDLFNGEQELVFVDTYFDDYYEGLVTNELGADIGEYPLLVRVRDWESDQNLGDIDAWNVVPIRVGYKNGWVRVWGAEGHEYCYSMAMDGDDIFIVGAIEYDMVDFDPGPGVDEYEGSWTFLCKYDTDGNYQWVRLWGKHPYSYDCTFVTVDNSGYVYVAGTFNHQPWDFDPGPDVLEKTSNGGSDVYLSKFDPSNGDLIWNHTWGAAAPNPFQEGDDEVRGVATDSANNIYVTGYFLGTADFDPTDGVDEHTAMGWWDDIFVTRFDQYGTYLGTITFGGEEPDYPQDIEVDSQDNTWVCGYYEGTVDFDPGPGEVNLTANGGRDSFMSKYSPDGVLLWAGSWGSPKDYEGAIDIEMGQYDEIYVIGNFAGKVDFDPGPDILQLGTPYGPPNVYLCRYNQSCDLQWAIVWGNGGGRKITTGEMGEIYVLGGDGDLDPGPGTDYADAYSSLIRFSQSGEYVWGWGNDYWGPRDLVVSDAGNIYITGGFGYQNCDFDPGLGVEEYSTWNNPKMFLAMYPPDLFW